jgi:zinc protease
MLRYLLAAACTLAAAYCCHANYKPVAATDSYGRQYTYYSGCPVGMAHYQLPNGLQLYLSKNTDNPKVQAYIAVKAGSTYDPAETTGLAHYLEHMMFKGTGKIGALHWDKEKQQLDTLAVLFEEHKAEQDAERKKAIYAEIDSVSQLAASFAAANEYDNIMKMLGADGTNAYTWYEETVYMNTVPSNSLKLFLEVERERFGSVTLRLFHTELETVYEEFNMSQDNERRKLHYALVSNLFPTHPYGTQTTLGKAEHLKNPSMLNIYDYFSTYYAPNNMAICLTGDIEPAQAAHWIDSLWGNMEPSELPELNFPEQEPIAGPIITDVYGPGPESMALAFRTKGAGTDEELYVTIIDYLLSSGGRAGLIDLNLVKQQKVLGAGCHPYFMRDYGMHLFFGSPRAGQQLEEVKKLLLAEIEKIKNGQFDEWLIEAAINDIKLSRLKAQESNGISSEFVSAFTLGYGWDWYLSMPGRLQGISKQSIMEQAARIYRSDNYVAVNKRTGTDTAIIKVEKPQITPVPLNRGQQSAYMKEIAARPLEKLQPMFIDYGQELMRSSLNQGVVLNYVPNTTNELFSLYYIIDKGSKHCKYFPLAVSYLEYLGTKKYTSEDFAKELYRYGLNFGVNAGQERSYVYISGLNSSFSKGLELMDHILSNAVHDKKAYADFIEGVLKSRADAKIDRRSIASRLLNYGRYGKNSPMLEMLSEKELRKAKPAALAKAIREMRSYEHDIFYYGPMQADSAAAKIAAYSKPATKKLDNVPPPPLAPADTVYFVHYDMVQANIYMLSNGPEFSPELMPYSAIFNEYFGQGLSSIVFQEIRESKGLAYSAFSRYTEPAKAGENSYCVSFVGTSPDKAEEAIAAMRQLLAQMPADSAAFSNSRQAIADKIAGSRITKTGIYFSYLSNKDRGIKHDIRSDIYKAAEAMQLQELESFFNANISAKPIKYMIMADRNTIDMQALSKLGIVKELSIEEIFGY